MLTQENIREFINKFQTNERNIAREYIQHLFLSSLYKLHGSEKLLFKSGTALRLIFLSPCFSEDLDFTGQGISRHEEVDNMFLDTVAEIEKAGVNISYNEAKLTTGGYLGIIHYELFDLIEDMKFEVSLRKRGKAHGELVTIASELAPPYTLSYLSSKELVSEKIAALLARRKPRDYYDLYFMLRNNELNKFVDKSKLKIIRNNLTAEKINFKEELAVLLPVSHHIILKDFKNILTKEIGRYI